MSKFETHKSIIDIDNEESYDIGDTVSIGLHNGGGFGKCTITKITDKGFHYIKVQGSSRVKSIQYKDIRDINGIK